MGLGSDGEDEVYGDFEDLESGEVFSGTGKKEETEEEKQKAEEEEAQRLREEKLKLKESFNEEYDTTKEMGMTMSERTANRGIPLAPGIQLMPGETLDPDEEEAEMLKERERKLHQVQLTKEEYEQEKEELKSRHYGFPPGLYIRIEFSDVPAEFVSNFKVRGVCA